MSELWERWGALFILTRIPVHTIILIMYMSKIAVTHQNHISAYQVSKISYDILPIHRFVKMEKKTMIPDHIPNDMPREYRATHFGKERLI